MFIPGMFEQVYKKSYQPITGPETPVRWRAPPRLASCVLAHSLRAVTRATAASSPLVQWWAGTSEAALPTTALVARLISPVRVAMAFQAAPAAGASLVSAELQARAAVRPVEESRGWAEARGAVAHPLPAALLPVEPAAAGPPPALAAAPQARAELTVAQAASSRPRVALPAPAGTRARAAAVGIPAAAVGIPAAAVARAAATARDQASAG